MAQERRALLAQFSGEFLQTMNHITLKNTAHSQVLVRVAQQELAQAGIKGSSQVMENKWLRLVEYKLEADWHHELSEILKDRKRERQHQGQVAQ